MKLLVIDDDRHVANKIAAAVAEFGEVAICTVVNSFSGVMPPKDEVISAIAGADFILLDGMICGEYDGKDLLPHCTGKKVLGISNSSNLGEHNWHGKGDLKYGAPNAIDSLKAKVAEMIS